MKDLTSEKSLEKIRIQTNIVGSLKNGIFLFFKKMYFFNYSCHPILVSGVQSD